jgi:transcriptional regulator with XRE-family HTH domain
MANEKPSPTSVKISKRHLAQRRAKKITLRELAETYGVSTTTIWLELKRQGFPTGKPRGRSADREKHEEVLRLAAKGLSLHHIGKQLGLSAEGVRRVLARYGRPTSSLVFWCSRCGAQLTTGKRTKVNPHALCLSCLQKEPNTSLAMRVRSLRLAAHLTQEELAALSGLSSPTIWKIEQEGWKPAVESIAKVAKALKVNLATLLESATLPNWGDMENRVEDVSRKDSENH